MSDSISVEDRAVELFMAGYNCAQAVYAAFAPQMGISEKQAAQTASALGGGLCRMREACGAVSGGILALGTLKGYNIPDDGAKLILYARGQRVMGQFKEKFGTLRCAELLNLPANFSPSPVPTPRTKEFYQQRPCAKFVYEIAKLVAEELEKPEPVL